MDYESLVGEEIAFPFKGKDYVLKEATADVRIRYQNAQIASMERVGDRLFGKEGIADTELLLVQGCLFERTDKGDGAVAMGFVKALGGRLVAQLFEDAKRISDIGQPATIEYIDAEIAKLEQQRKLLLEKLDPKALRNGTMAGSE